MFGSTNTLKPPNILQTPAQSLLRFLQSQVNRIVKLRKARKRSEIVTPLLRTLRSECTLVQVGWVLAKTLGSLGFCFRVYRFIHPRYAEEVTSNERCVENWQSLGRRATACTYSTNAFSPSGWARSARSASAAPGVARLKASIPATLIGLEGQQ